MARGIGDVVQPSGRTNAPELVKKAMKARGYTQAMLAKKLGYSGSNAIAMALSGRNMRVDIFLTMLNALDFEVVIKDKNTTNRENVWNLEHTLTDAGEE